MSRMIATATLRSRKDGNGRPVRAGMMTDSGAAITAVSQLIAKALGLKCGAAEDTLHIGGRTIPVCYRRAEIVIPGADCDAGEISVAVPVGEDDLLPILGADFLQRAGGVLDFRKNEHAILCDPLGRDPTATAEMPVPARTRQVR